jgi:Flp pilus assembly protein protease CpaA
MFEVLSLLNVSFNYSEIFSASNIFLIICALLWMIFAIIEDFRRREVENWWSFSFIIFILAFKAFISIEKSNYGYFLWALIGFAAGFIISNAFYYGRMFAGGDAKFLMAFFTLLPLSLSWQTNLMIIILFVFLLIMAGGVYGLIYSLILILFNFKTFSKSYIKQFKKYQNLILIISLLMVFLGIILIILHQLIFILLCLLIFIAPYLLLSAKAIEESCMNRLVDVKDLTVGDWLVKSIKIQNKTIKPYWEGLSEKELALIKKNYRQKVLVKYGLPFTPAFFIAFILTLIILYYNFI